MSGHTSRVGRPAIATRIEATSPERHEGSVRGTIRVAAGVGGAMTFVVCAIALSVSVALAALARRWLAYPFTGIPARPGEAAAIFVHNLRALVAAGGLLLIAQSRYWTGQPKVGLLHRTVQRAGEALLAAGIAVNVVVVGASLGAYGERMVRAVLPHGPVELAAYSLALALCLQGRERPLPARRVWVVLGLSTSLLALAAALETFVNV